MGVAVSRHVGLGLGLGEGVRVRVRVWVFVPSALVRVVTIAW
jgi:hypothetical protein